MIVSSMSLLIFAITVALIFDLINGFHDAANSIATVVSTRVLKPHIAVLWAAFFNFAAMLIFTPKVAETISNIVKIDPGDPIFVYVILTGLIGAIFWNLLTWWLGLPTSSSHALIGGFSGAGVAYAGWGVLHWDALMIILVFIILAPLLGFILGSLFLFSLYWIFRNYHPTNVYHFFRRGQLLSAAFYSLGHGGNDAQKTMGIIMAILFAGGILPKDEELSLTNDKTFWIILVCHLAMGLGTALGGWRIVKTMGMKITKLKPMGGFSAETAGAVTLFFATFTGIPVSTTHTITGSIMGVGSLSSKVSAVKWGIAARIAWAWVLTVPASGIVSAISFLVIKSFI